MPYQTTDNNTIDKIITSILPSVLPTPVMKNNAFKNGCMNSEQTLPIHSLYYLIPFSLLL